MQAKPILLYLSGPMEPLIKSEGLYRYFAGFCAVCDLSFELQRGEVLGFLGPNGAGKSTTMRILCGALAASRGRVWLNGIDLQERPVEAKTDLGYLPENPPVYRDLTVDEYLDFCARLRRIPKARRTAARQQTKKRCGLEGAGRRLIGNLSKGYQQRVGIAQAIIHEPKLVILDEPTSGLDPNQIREIRSLIRELAQTQGVILSTHILPEVQAVCDRVQILHAGRLVFSERLEDLRRHHQHGLLLTTAQQLNVALLRDLPGVICAEPLTEHRFRLQLDRHADPGAIADQVVANGWGLQQLCPEQEGLEQIFTRLTTRESIQ